MEHHTCVVFDIDDTLYLEREYVRSGFEAIDGWAVRWLSVNGFGECCWNRFLAGQRGSIFDCALRHYGLHPSPELIAALVQLYRSHRPSITLCPDAAETLKKLARTARLAVVSDGPLMSQSRKVEALGIESFAKPIVLTELLGAAYSKPHPRPFEYVMKSVKAKSYVYVGDNPLKDFAAPNKLGWMTIRVRRPGGLHYDAPAAEIFPDHEAGDCCLIPDLLSHLS